LCGRSKGDRLTVTKPTGSRPSDNCKIFTRGGAQVVQVRRVLDHAYAA